jgi:hypothetical protein
VVIWAGALGASLVAHAGAAAVLVWATLPNDVPDQPTPETQLQLAAFQVPRTEAAATEPDSDSLTSSEVDSAKLGQGIVPTSRAEVQTPRAERSEAITAQGDTLDALEADADPVAVTRPPSDETPVITSPGERVADSQPQIDRAEVQSAVPQTASVVAPTLVTMSSVAPSAPSASSLQPQAQPAATKALAAAPAAAVVTGALRMTEEQPPSLSPTAAALPSVAVTTLPPETETATDTAPPSTALAQERTSATQVASLAPPSTRASAQLAFPGQGDGPVDPVSLAAFQSFMAPGDVGSAAAEVRDSIAGALSAIPCARLQARFDPDENTLVMTGHVPEDSARETVLTAMQEKMGTDIPVREDLLILPRPQCGALTGISNVGLPQSTDQITNPLLLGAGTHVREFSYSAGQALVLDIQGADYDAYVYVDFFDAAGNVVHLKPNDFTPLVNTPAKSPLQIGSPRPLNPGEPGLYIQIGPPFGQEIAVAFAASEPLYDGVRPLVEPAEPYLDWLRERVSEARETHPDFKGEWVYFFVSTTPE